MRGRRSLGRLERAGVGCPRLETLLASVKVRATDEFKSVRGTGSLGAVAAAETFQVRGASHLIGIKRSGSRKRGVIALPPGRGTTVRGQDSDEKRHDAEGSNQASHNAHFCISTFHNDLLACAFENSNEIFLNIGSNLELVEGRLQVANGGIKLGLRDLHLEMHRLERFALIFGRAARGNADKLNKMFLEPIDVLGRRRPFFDFYGTKP